MLICGEDLGMVPASVPGVMKELGILGLHVQRMPADPAVEFSHPNDAPYLSVVTPSSHDTSTMRGWWEEDRVRTQRFFRNHARPLARGGPVLLRALGGPRNPGAAPALAGHVGHFPAPGLAGHRQPPAPRQPATTSKSTCPATPTTSGNTGCTCRWRNWWMPSGSMSRCGG